MKLDSFKKRLLIIGIIVLLAVALPITVYLVQQQQNLRQGAVNQKHLDLTVEESKNYSKGDTVKVDLFINPSGVNAKEIKTTVNYDSSILNITNSGFTPNPQFSLENQTVNFNDGNINLDFKTSNSNNYVSNQILIGTLTFTVVENPDTGTTQVSFGPGTQIIDEQGNVQTDYVFNPANITIGAAVCIPDQSTCSWDAAENATGYHYTVIKQDQAETVVREGDTTDTSVTFTSEAGGTYTCTVYAVNTANNCNTQGPSDSNTQTCSTPTPTPTLTPALIPTSIPPTATPTIKSLETPAQPDTGGAI